LRRKVVNVLATAPNQIVNQVTVSGGGSPTAQANDPTVTGPLTIITFGHLPDVVVTVPPFGIDATASSGLPVSFVSATPVVCNLTDSVVTVIAAGICEVTANQAGSDTFAAAIPVTQTFTVNAPTGPSSTILSTSVNPGTLGESISLIAAVLPSTAVGGTVSFYDGMSLLGSKALTTGTATMSTTLLNSGPHSLRAFYSGGTNFPSSSSAVLREVINALPEDGFGSPVSYGAGAPGSMAVADFSGDGNADLAVVDGNGGSVNILIGNGDGTFRTALPVRVGSYPVFLAAGDFNADGKADLAVADTSVGNMYVLLGNGDGTFQASTKYVVGGAPEQVLVADFNGDGKADLAFANPLNECVSILLGNGDGAFQALRNFGIGTNPFSIAFGDFNGDGKTDLIVTAGGGILSVLLGNGDGTFHTAVDYAAGGRSAGSITVDDFNNDEKADLVVGNPYESTVSVLIGNGDGTFGAPVTYTVDVPPSAIATGDVDGDGKPDLVAVGFTATEFSSTNGASIFRGNGDGTFQAPRDFAIGDGEPRFLLIGDFNRDGRTDLALTNGKNTTIFLSGFVPTPAHFIPVPPCRLADTRGAGGTFGSPALVGDQTRDFPVPSGECAIPSNAKAYSLNLTVVPHGPLGYVTIWPTGQTQPVASTLNSLDGRVKANASIVPAGTSGAVSVYATDDTDVILDINGYFVAPSDSTAEAFYPVSPCRLVDTRAGASSTVSSGALMGGTSRTLPLLSSPCNVPSTAVAYSLNFTAIPSNGTLGYLTVYPTGVAQPVVSTLNAPTGTIVANAGIIPAGTSGSIDVFATDATDVVVDINGYFAAPGTGGLSFYPLPPCRVLDSRNPSGSLPFTNTMNVNVIGTGCANATAAQAYVFNATVVPPAPLGYLTLWPEGTAQPVVSTLNALDGSITSNMAIVPANDNAISAFADNATYLILDTSGYFAP
jgi:hypothetical protein